MSDAPVSVSDHGRGLTETERALLGSLVDGPKHLSMGRSPVAAITMAWDFADRGLVSIVSETIAITDAGRTALQGSSS